MDGRELLWTVFELLPVLFALDVVAFHFTGDHPLAMRWWWRRSRSRSPHRRTARC